MKRSNLSSIIALILLVTLLAACGQTGANGDAASAEAEAGKLNVVATTGQIHDAVANIVGDAANLTGMFGPGVDPHLYVPTESDVSLLGRADVIFYNGLHLEAQMTRVLDQMAQRGVTVVAVGDALPEERLLSWDSNYPHDPHIWNDPELWSLGVEAIRDTLVEADPANADLYRQNAKAYLAGIAETHAYVKAQAEQIPAEQRIMITAHDAFGYFARAYGFEVRGLQGISTESEAGTADVQELVDFIVSRKAPAIFVETSVSPRNIEAVQAAVKARGFEVNIGGQLYSDALGDPGTPEGTYAGMLRHNIDTLVNALTAQLAESN
jgi:manganese/zinc/iron transport system substrate-binding protein